MLFETYFQIKETLRKKFRDRLKKINSDIYIRDIFISPVVARKHYENAYGESSYKQTRPFDFPRLIDHVQTLAEIANQYHQKYYCDVDECGNVAIKPDCLNKITRLSLSEFLLYTKEPMSINDFKLFHAAVMEIAKKQQKNVHLLLSSISVCTPDNKILNMSLYVQCGPEPKIEVLSKAMASDVDPSYPRTENFNQYDENHQRIIDGGTNSFIAAENEFIASNKSVFEIETAGGARYTQAIDVCRDHAFKHSLTLMCQSIDHENDTGLIPNQVDHFLTSCSIPIFEQAKLTEHVVHNDPHKGLINNKPMPNDKITAIDLMKCNRNKAMLISQSKNGFLVRNPIFGGNYTITASEERQLGGFVPILQNHINDRNKKLENDFIKNRFQETEYSRLVNRSDDIMTKLSHLYRLLFKQCHPGFFERLFNTRSYQIKIQAQEMIQASLNIAREWREKDEIYVMQYVDYLLPELKGRLEKIDYGIPHTFVTKLMNTIDQAAMYIHPLKLTF